MREFHEAYKCLPLNGKIPDMTADTDSYIKMQGVYRAKAERDRKELLSNALALAEKLGVAGVNEEYV